MCIYSVIWGKKPLFQSKNTHRRIILLQLQESESENQRITESEDGLVWKGP